MFLKVVRSAQNNDYVYVVEGYRDSEGRIKHRYLFSLGRLDEFLQSVSFRKLAKKALLNEKDKRVSLSSISEGRIIHYGHCLIKKLWDKFNFDEFFRSVDTNKQFDIVKAVFYITARHIIQPDSKLGMYEGKDSYIGFEQIGINHLYRALRLVKKMSVHKIFSQTSASVHIKLILPTEVVLSICSSVSCLLLRI